ncbi:MAG: hypothetical protein WD627_05115 [Actinomycetota bacterium]
MYNLIVTGDCDAWDRARGSMDASRIGEYTPEALKERYRRLDTQAKDELQSFPTLFAYEKPCDKPAKIGRVTRFRESSGANVRFEIQFAHDAPPVPPTLIDELGWELDIGDWEMNRTHWAVKDVDLFDVLGEALQIPDLARGGAAAPVPAVEIAPTVFSLPSRPPEDDLVALMMPFDSDRAPILRAVQAACGQAGLRCVRADDIWEDSTIIQDIFSLIFRSRIVVADLTGLNGNVLYETGIAHTLGRAVIPISEDTGRLPFDLAHHRTLFFEPSKVGLSKMVSQLERRLRRLAAGSS